MMQTFTKKLIILDNSVGEWYLWIIILRKNESPIPPAKHTAGAKTSNNLTITPIDRFIQIFIKYLQNNKIKLHKLLEILSHLSLF